MMHALHRHLLHELDRSGRVDLLVVFSSIVFDLLSIGVTSALATSRSGAAQLVFLLFMGGVCVVTACALATLANGWRTCNACQGALLALYRAGAVAQHYPAQGAGLRRTRNLLLIVLTASLGALALAVPLLVRTYTP